MGRAVIAAEFGKIIDAVVLHEHRIATIHMKPDAGGYRDATRLTGSASASLLAFPDVRVTLAEIFA